MICDAHVHLDERMKEIVLKHKIPAIISCTTPNECEQAQQLCKQYAFLSYSCGIHPWRVDKITWEMMYPYIEQAQIIGEIGMDSVWCEQDREKQFEVFNKQIAYASARNKPVILHTKGEEKAIAELIKQYPNTYLVHWYSCMEYLELYKEMGCYFSVGPDVYNNECVKRVVKQVDLDHLLIESDGLAAIEWALLEGGQNLYTRTMNRTLNYIAHIKNVSKDEAATQVYKNYKVFVEIGRR